MLFIDEAGETVEAVAVAGPSNRREKSIAKKRKMKDLERENIPKAEKLFGSSSDSD